MASIYILKSLKNNTFYIGSTNNLKRRLDEHQFGKSKYTRLILPFELMFSQEYQTLKQARRAELWLKKQKNREIILRIIEEKRISKLFN